MSADLILGDTAADAARGDAPASPRGRHRLLRKVAGYSAVRGVTEGVLGLRGILLATLLGPAAFGSWALLRLATRYAALAGMGVFRGLEVELLNPGERPTAAAGGRSDAAGAALGFMLAVSGTLAMLALLVSAFIETPNHRLVLQGFAAAVVAEAVYGYALVATRVRTTLFRYSLLEMGTATLHLGLGVILTWWFGLAGAFAALALSSAVGAAAASRWTEMRPVFRSPSLRTMLGIGLPVALTGAVGTLLNTADRWVVAVWGGEALLGYYAFAGALASAATALALAVRTVVFPEVYSDARLAGAATALRRHLERSLMPFATLVPPILGAIGVCLGPMVSLVAPAYAEAVAPARLFLLAGAAIGVVNLAAIGVVAAGQQRLLPGYAALALGFTLGLSIAALLLGAGLEGVAAASLIGHLVFATAVLRLNARLSGIGQGGQLAARALRPLAWCAVAVAVAGRVAVELDSELAGLGLYLLLMVPLASKALSEWRRLHGAR